MTNILLAVGVGGAAGVGMSLADNLVLGTVVEVETVLKYATPIAGLVWWFGRQFQLIKDELKTAREELTIARLDRENVQEWRAAMAAALHNVHESVKEIRTYCPGCKEVIDLDTPTAVGKTKALPPIEAAEKPQE